MSFLTIEVAGSSVVITSTNSPVTRNKHLRRYAGLPLDVWKEHALDNHVSAKVLADVTHVFRPKIAGDGGQVRPLFLENYDTGVRPTTDHEESFRCTPSVRLTHLIGCEVLRWGW